MTGMPTRCFTRSRCSRCWPGDRVQRPGGGPITRCVRRLASDRICSSNSEGITIAAAPASSRSSTVSSSALNGDAPHTKGWGSRKPRYLVVKSIERLTDWARSARCVPAAGLSPEACRISGSAGRRPAKYVGFLPVSADLPCAPASVMPAVLPVIDAESDVLLRDGTTLRLRSVRDGDAPAVLALFEQLSERSLYYRFMLVPHLHLAQVRRLLAVDERSQGLLVAERGGVL